MKADVEHKAFCGKEFKESDRNLSDSKHEKGQLEAKIDSLEAEIDGLRSEIGAANEEIAATQIEIKKAGEDRGVQMYCGMEV